MIVYHFPPNEVNFHVYYLIFCMIVAHKLTIHIDFVVYNI